MSHTTDGGPAFPIPRNHDSGDAIFARGDGMTLLDYFAGKALTGYRCAYHQWYQQVGATGEFATPDQIAEWSYADAKAMLRAREK